MKRIILYLIFGSLFFTNLYSQDYWSKSYDPFMHEAEEITNIMISDSILFVASRGTCFKDSVLECFKMLKFDLKGNLLDGYEDSSFENGFGMVMDEDWIYVDGGNEPISTKVKVKRILKDFSESQTLEANVPNGRRFTNRSCISNSTHVVAYGSYVELSGLNRTNGIQVWVNKETFSIDTIITLAPTRRALNITNMTVDEEGSFYLIAIDKYLNENENELEYHRIIKQDSIGNIVEDFAYTDGIIRSINWPSSILVNNENIYFFGFDEESNSSIICLDKTGKKIWEHIFEHDYSRTVLPLGLKLKSNNNILVIGSQRAPGNGWIDIGFLLEIDKDNGEVEWEHVIEIDKGDDEIFGVQFSKVNYFIDIEELDNGDLILGGKVKEVYDDSNYGDRHDNDLWLLKLDANGCLVENCEYMQSLNDGELLTDTCKWILDDAEWCYSQFSLNPNQDLAQVDIIGDTLVGNRLCSVMGLYDEGVMVAGSKLICFYEEENEFVYFYEDEEFKLLYDFSFSVLPGDTVEYFLPRNFDVYDISSGQGFAETDNGPYKYRYIDQEWAELEDGELHRIVETMPVPNANGECFLMGRIIDGIGSDRGFMGKNCASLTAGYGSFFRVYESNELNYSEVEDGCIVTSVGDIEDYNMDIYPNPARDIVHISSPQQLMISVELYNSVGAIVGTEIINGQEHLLDSSNFPQGIYFLTVVLENGGKIVQKLVLSGR